MLIRHSELAIVQVEQMAEQDTGQRALIRVDGMIWMICLEEPLGQCRFPPVMRG